MRMREVESLEQLRYTVSLIDGPIRTVGEMLHSLAAGRKLVMVTTPTVGELYVRAIEKGLRQLDDSVFCLTIATTEREKCLGMVEEVCAFAESARADRRTVLVSIGGGVCSDIVTVAASLIRRGISHVRVPTTLIGIVDAGIGVKGAVNFRGRKSYLGCFYPPEFVLLNRKFLATVPIQHIRAGLAEIVKMAIIRSPRLFALVNGGAGEGDWDGPRLSGDDPVSQEIIWLSADAMLDELETNLLENKTYERRVDLGHTFSPILEAASNYELPHGQAVAIDLALSSALSSELGLLNRGDFESICELLSGLGLPTYSPLLTIKKCTEALEAAARHRGGAVNLILPTSIGEVICFNDSNIFSVSLLQRALGSLREVLD